MDVNATLRVLRQAYSDYEDTRGNAQGPEIDAADRMRDAIVALDEWLTRGGFLPAAWSANRSLPVREV